MVTAVLLFLLIVAVAYHERRIRKLENEVQTMRRKPQPPVTEEGDLRNVGEVAVEQHERRYHSKR